VSVVVVPGWQKRRCVEQNETPHPADLISQQ
jgi:hypothetical protein